MVLQKPDLLPASHVWLPNWAKMSFDFLSEKMTAKITIALVIRPPYHEKFEKCFLNTHPGRLDKGMNDEK
jgi:hypothetical protein